jgi:hypothetical protein
MQTRQVVHIIKQSILLRCLWFHQCLSCLLQHYSRYSEALNNGVFDEEIVPVDLGDKLGRLTQDEEPSKHDWTNLSSLPTIWGDTIARGSSSKLADGAAACLLVNETGLKKYFHLLSRLTFDTYTIFYQVWCAPSFSNIT